MHVTRRASGLETRPDIARGFITRAFLVSRCCSSEFYCKACAFSFSDDIDDSCTRLRLWNSSLNVLRVVNTSPRLPPRSASQDRAHIAVLRSPFRTLLPYLHHSRLRRSRRHRPSLRLPLRSIRRQSKRVLRRRPASLALDARFRDLVWYASFSLSSPLRP